MIVEAAPARIDAHCHVWRQDDGESFPLRTKIAALARDFTLDELAGLQRARGIAGSVLVQAVDSRSESERLLDLAAHDARILGVVAWADPTDPAFVEVVDAYRARPKFVGLRPMPSDTFGGEWLHADATRRSLRHLARLECPLDLFVVERHLGAACGLLRSLETLPCVVNHAGRPAVMAGARAQWRTDMAALAALPRVHVKCSGLVERAGVEWTCDTLRPWILDLVEIFGAERVMFGSNWPVVTLAARYDGWVDALLTILAEAGASAAAVDRIMSGTAKEFYGLATVAGASSH